MRDISSEQFERFKEHEYHLSLFQRAIKSAEKLKGEDFIDKEHHIGISKVEDSIQSDNDKIQRIKNLLMKGRKSAVDESVEDAFLDLSNYGIMATLVKEQKWGK